ncbi:MAG: Response regulator receiver domain [Burkholderiales bacterium]|jgi:DNA-binding NarL/FixJ family response regulator|nr:Response regulator receiver domain [Burkholderiales bacterium]
MCQQRLRRIAIADGSPAFLTAAADYIAALPGYVLAGTADTALQAPALVTSAGPDVLLLDLGRPSAPGLEMVRRVKSTPGAPAVVAMTLFHTPETAAAAQHAGADALVGKESFVSGLSQALARLFP